MCKNAVIFIEVIKMVPCELHWMAEMPCGLQVAGTTVLVSRRFVAHPRLGPISLLFCWMVSFLWLYSHINVGVGICFSEQLKICRYFTTEVLEHFLVVCWC